MYSDDSTLSATRIRMYHTLNTSNRDQANVSCQNERQNRSTVISVNINNLFDDAYFERLRLRGAIARALRRALQEVQ